MSIDLIASSHLASFFGRATREGYLDALSSDFEQLTGQAPRSLRTVLESERGADAQMAA